MTLDEFRVEMLFYWNSAYSTHFKQPFLALKDMRSLYEKFDDRERGMADTVLAEWVLSDDENLRFLALILIDDFKINKALPALHKLATRLTLSKAPGAPFELERVLRHLASISS